MIMIIDVFFFLLKKTWIWLVNNMMTMMMKQRKIYGFSLTNRIDHFLFFIHCKTTREKKSIDFLGRRDDKFVYYALIYFIIIKKIKGKRQKCQSNKKKKPQETFQKKTKVVRFTINDFCFGFHSVNCHHHHYLDPKWQQQLVGRYISHRFRKKNFIGVFYFFLLFTVNRFLFQCLS